MKAVIRLLVVCFMMIALTSVAFAGKDTAKNAGRIAVIPYINATEESNDGIQALIDEKYTHYFEQQGFEVVGQTQVLEILQQSGYDTALLELPAKDVLAAVGQAANADYVIAMELVQLTTTQDASMFNAKAMTKAELKYKFYSAGKDQEVSFNTSSVTSAQIRTSLGDASVKSPSIDKALEQALNNANKRLGKIQMMMI